MKRQNFGSQRATIAIIAAVLMGLSLVGCVTVYKPPKAGEPTALIKLQYRYNQIRADTTLWVSLQIREGEKKGFRQAYQQDVGSVAENKEFLEVAVHSMKIRPTANTAIRMRLGFWWVTQEMVPVTTYVDNRPVTNYEMQAVSHEVGCGAAVIFTPDADKIYLLSYINPSVDTGCSANAFLQTPKGDGTFTLRSVGAPLSEG